MDRDGCGCQYIAHGETITSSGTVANWKQINWRTCTRKIRDISHLTSFRLPFRNSCSPVTWPMEHFDEWPSAAIGLNRVSSLLVRIESSIAISTAITKTHLFRRSATHRGEPSCSWAQRTLLPSHLRRNPTPRTAWDRSALDCTW